MKYFWLTLKHKWFVFCAGLKTKAPLWRLIIHDWSKFLPSELPHYNRQFFGKADDPKGFVECWTKHQNRHPHHWEYWIPRTGHTRCDPPYLDGEPIAMPEWAVREMIADWLSAGRSYEGKYPDVNDWTWLKKNVNKFRLHPDTWKILTSVIAELKMDKMIDGRTKYPNLNQDKVETTSTFRAGDECKHINGWYVYAEFLYFKRKYFSCSDCGALIPKGRWKVILKNF